MNWLTGSKQGEAKKLISQLADAAKRDAAAQGLIQLGADSVQPLIEALQTQDLGLVPIYEQILARIPSATPALIKTMSTAHPIIRGRAAEVFIYSRDKTAVPALLDALKGEFFTVRARAALALGSIGDPKVIPALMPLLKDSEDEVRAAVCTALGRFNDPSTFDEIANIILDDPKIEVRQSAARALGDTKNPAAIPFLMEALRDSFWWYEREQSVKILLNAVEKMGTPVVEPLIDALVNDREGTVRKYAAMVLGNLRDIRAIEELGMAMYDLHHEVSLAAAEAIANFGETGLGVLIEALSHPEAAVREHAIIGLAKIRDARVAPALIQMLNDPERVVQKQALQSLGKIGDPKALPILQQIAANRADREFAMIAKQILESNK